MGLLCSISAHEPCKILQKSVSFCGLQRERLQSAKFRRIQMNVRKVVGTAATRTCRAAAVPKSLIEKGRCRQNSSLLTVDSCTIASHVQALSDDAESGQQNPQKLRTTG